MKLIQSALTPEGITFKSMVAGSCYRQVGTANVFIAIKLVSWDTCYPVDVVTGHMPLSDELSGKLFVEVEAEIHVK